MDDKRGESAKAKTVVTAFYVDTEPLSAEALGALNAHHQVAENLLARNDGSLEKWIAQTAVRATFGLGGQHAKGDSHTLVIYTQHDKVRTARAMLAERLALAGITFEPTASNDAVIAYGLRAEVAATVEAMLAQHRCAGTALEGASVFYNPTKVALECLCRRDEGDYEAPFTFLHVVSPEHRADRSRIPVRQEDLRWHRHQPGVGTRPHVERPEGAGDGQDPPRPRWRAANSAYAAPQ